MQCAETERLTMPDQKYADLLGVRRCQANARKQRAVCEERAMRRHQTQRSAPALPARGRPAEGRSSSAAALGSARRKKKIEPIHERTRVDACLRTQDHGPTPRAHVFATVDLVFQGAELCIVAQLRHYHVPKFAAASSKGLYLYSFIKYLITRPFSAAPAGSTTFGPHDARTDLLGVGERTTGKRRSLSLLC